MENFQNNYKQRLNSVYGYEKSIKQKPLFEVHTMAAPETHSWFYFFFCAAMTELFSQLLSYFYRPSLYLVATA